MRCVAHHNRQSVSMDHDNLDPFLDIISNVVGILIVVAVLIAISISTATTTVHAPLLYEPPAEIAWEEEVFCSNGRVLPVEGNELASQLHQFARIQFGSDWRCDQRGVSIAWKYWLENKDSFQGQYFRVGDFYWDDDAQYASALLTPVAESGDDLKKLKSKESWFRNFLATKDPARDGITLIASPTGFREFQAARDIAKSAGFHVQVRIFKSDTIYWTLYGQLAPSRSGGRDVQ